MHRLPFFAVALVALLSGVWAGIIRLGFDLPGIELATLHGPLMVGGFVGTVIGIERSLLSGQKRWWVIPGSSGMAVILWLAGFRMAAPLALLVSSALLVLMQAMQLRSPVSPQVTIIQLAGALCFSAGAFQLAFKPFMPAIVPWWMGFVLCFILATRLWDRSFPNRWLQLIVGLGFITFLLGLLMPFHWRGHLVAGGGLIAVAAGMLATEADGLTGRWSMEGYTGLAVALGWAWLAVAGIGMAFWHGHLYGYDATVHAFFLGFLFSMVLAHALGKAQIAAGLPTQPFHPVLFVWLLLLSLSLLARVLAGDLLMLEAVRRWAGLVNGISIGGFIINLVTLTVYQKVKSRVGTV